MELFSIRIQRTFQLVSTDKGKTSVSLPIDNIMDTLKKYTV